MKSTQSNKVGDHPRVTRLTEAGYVGCNACGKMLKEHGKLDDGTVICPGTTIIEDDDGNPRGEWFEIGKARS